ncbi:hypothetical protein ACO0K0_01505 [Undibacterium sp. SXout11W]|uniref:hypothetical protein n=1 Tax=Undibacterium sp. SXout11W TaxID=3413050 RepID=UPI003BF24881
MKLTIEEDLILVGIGIAIVTAWYMKQGASKIVDTASAAVSAVNPMNPDNVINQGATSVYQNTTGSTGSIGSDIYDWFHPSEGKSLTAPTPTKPSGDMVHIDDPKIFDPIQYLQ